MTMIIPTPVGATAMIDDFLIRAGVAAMLVAIAAAPLGCFMLWRGMVFLATPRPIPPFWAW